MSVDEPPTPEDYQIAIREPGRRTGLILLWLVFFASSIWLFASIPRDLGNVLLAIAFVVGVTGLLGLRTYLTLRPRGVRIDDFGITIRFARSVLPARIAWSEMESVELQDVFRPGGWLSRFLMGQAYFVQTGSQAVLVRLRHAYGLGRWMLVPFIGMPHSRTVYLSVVDAPRFVEMANEHLTHERKVRVDRPS